jgi:hypothetical protein
MMRRTIAALVLFTGTAAAQGAPPPVDEKPATEPAPTAAPPATPAPAVAPAPVPAPAASPSPGHYSPWMAPPAAPEASAPVKDSEPEEPLPPPSPPGWQAWIGGRTSFFKSKGFDPFSRNDVYPTGSIGASRSLYVSSPLSFAAALTFDFGSKSADARGEPTSLQTYRLTVGPEARYHLLPQLYAFVRPTAGVQRTVATLDEGSTGATLAARDWLFAADGSAGAAWSFLDVRSKKFPLMFWLVGEGGYGITQSSDLLLEADSGSGAPERTAALDLGELSTSGPFFRLAVAGTF